MLRRILSHIALVVLAGVCVRAAEPAAVWLDVPFVKQEKNGCGAASVAMVMRFWQQQRGAAPSADADPVKIQLALYSPQAHGIYASALENYFRQRGYQAYAFQGRESDLEEHLQKGRPLMVALRTGGDALHYVVVAGFDAGRHVVLLNDPAQRKLLKQDLASFEKEWKGTSYWTLLAVPQAEKASSGQ